MDAAKNGAVDLVIMDVGLPDMDGRDAVPRCARTASRPPSSC